MEEERYGHRKIIYINKLISKLRTVHLLTSLTVRWFVSMVFVYGSLGKVDIIK